MSSGQKWPADFPSRLLAKSGPIGKISGNKAKAAGSSSSAVLQIIQSASFTDLLFSWQSSKIILPNFKSPMQAHAKCVVFMVGMAGDRLIIWLCKIAPAMEC